MASIAFIAPAPLKGSGGVFRIYNFANALISNGHSCDVYVFDAESRSVTDLNQDKVDFYGVHDVNIIKGTNILKEYDLVFATRWDTAQIVKKLSAKRKAYLVQDFEPCFNPLGDGTIAAENSYLYGLKTVTYGRWLALKLFFEYGNTPYYCNFATDLNAFTLKRTMRERLKTEPAICFVYQPEKPRRCPQLGVEALGIVKHFRPDVKFYFVGSNDPQRLWFDYESLGILNTTQLNELYNKCQVGFCLSSSNPSCNPFDMMAAGLPVVDLYRENNLYDMPDNGILLAHQTPESLAEAMLLILSDSEKLVNMSEFGVEYMKTRHVTQEINEFTAAVDSMLKDMTIDFDVVRACSDRYKMPPLVAQTSLNQSVIQQLKYQRDKLQPLIGNTMELCDDGSFPIIGKLTNALPKQHLGQDVDKHDGDYSFFSKLLRYIKRYVS